MCETITHRKMERADIAALVEIEQLSFPTPWTEEIFLHELEGNAYSHYIVLLMDDTVVGYCGSWIVLDECHITNVAIHPSYRGKGLGNELMERLLADCVEEGVCLVSLEVRRSNTIAQSMYEKYGFTKGGIRKNYYTDDGEDAIVMWVEL